MAPSQGSSKANLDDLHLMRIAGQFSGGCEGGLSLRRGAGDLLFNPRVGLADPLGKR